MTHNCKNCDSPIPYSQEIDGVIRVLNCRRYCLRCSPFLGHQKGGKKKRFSKYKTVDGIEYKWCNACKSFLSLDSFSTRSDRPKGRAGYCRQCSADAQQEIRQRYKQEAILYKGNQCVDCHLSFAPYIYDFHHLDPAQKDLSWTNMSRRSLDRNKTELDKCVLLCANCHRDRHHNSDNPNYCPHTT
jgi:hypothetical protein